MAFLFSLASSFTIGAIDGYKKGGIDNKLYYGSAAITSVFTALKGFNSILNNSQPPATKMATFLLGPPLMIGATMLNASYMGKAVSRVTYDDARPFPPIISA